MLIEVQRFGIKNRCHSDSLRDKEKTHDKVFYELVTKIENIYCGMIDKKIS